MQVLTLWPSPITCINWERAPIAPCLDRFRSPATSRGSYCIGFMQAQTAGWSSLSQEASGGACTSTWSAIDTGLARRSSLQPSLHPLKVMGWFGGIAKASFTIHVFHVTPPSWQTCRSDRFSHHNTRLHSVSPEAPRLAMGIAAPPTLQPRPCFNRLPSWPFALQRRAKKNLL